LRGLAQSLQIETILNRGEQAVMVITIPVLEGCASARDDNCRDMIVGAARATGDFRNGRLGIPTASALVESDDNGLAPPIAPKVTAPCVSREVVGHFSKDASRSNEIDPDSSTFPF
jgi:hypothetical protein